MHRGFRGVCNVNQNCELSWCQSWLKVTWWCWEKWNDQWSFHFFQHWSYHTENFFYGNPKRNVKTISFRRWMATNQNMRSHPPKLSNFCPIRINDLMTCCRGNKILSFKGSKCFLNLFSQIQSSLAHQQISQWTTKLTQRYFFIAFGSFIVSVIDLNFMHLGFWSWKYWFGGCNICSDNLWSWWWQFVVLVVTISCSLCWCRTLPRWGGSPTGFCWWRTWGDFHMTISMAQ